MNAICGKSPTSRVPHSARHMLAYTKRVRITFPFFPSTFMVLKNLGRIVVFEFVATKMFCFDHSPLEQKNSLLSRDQARDERAFIPTGNHTHRGGAWITLRRRCRSRRLTCRAACAVRTSTTGTRRILTFVSAKKYDCTVRTLISGSKTTSPSKSRLCSRLFIARWGRKKRRAQEARQGACRGERSRASSRPQQFMRARIAASIENLCMCIERRSDCFMPARRGWPYHDRKKGRRGSAIVRPGEAKR